MDDLDVVIVGLGFTGLPTAVAAAAAGARVTGLDSSAERITEVAGSRPGCGLRTVSEDALLSVLSSGRLAVRDIAFGVPAADVHVLCLPTPPDHRGGVDLRPLLDGVRAVGRVLRRGDMVIVQSTCPPGTVAERVVPLLERISRFRAGEDFHVACAPMRLDPGSKSHALTSIPRVVGGHTTRCSRLATHFLSAMADEVVNVATPYVAELSKIFENTFRMVNISLVNELAAVCRAYGVDVTEVLRAAGTKPFGFLGHRPSAGAGGDCVPVSARLLSTAARRRGLLSPLIDAALAVNDAMPAHTVQRLREAVTAVARKPFRNSRAMVLGVTYKADTPNVRQSAAVAVIEELHREASVGYHDPYVPELLLSDGTRLVSRDLGDVAGVDFVVIMTPHLVYEDLSWPGVPVFDCSTGEPCPVAVPSQAAAA
ncbi:nucleotide sugar dehydrogenase [Saccharothrix sp. NRRL B-16314]|uniref:nucleotide sugar dehydrogenase n=1 Tax=Saccharothrix sp. NRRL B-16314 TaxID=1463825 RepID=UPI0007C42F06|nr:nucleotide sugar dehydrogenase [Saccharothrix sp. NRRL B-16314]